MGRRSMPLIARPRRIAGIATVAMTVLTLLSLLVLLPARVLSLYEDQVGQFDWHKELVGIPSHISMSRGDKRSAIYLGSRSNAVASISPKNGAVAWRQVLAGNEELKTIQVGTKGVLSLTSMSSSTSIASHAARLWDSADGSLLWQHDIRQVPKRKLGGFDAVFVAAKAGTQDVIVLSPGGILTRVDGTTGQESWTVDLEYPARYTTVAAAGSSVFALGSAKDGSLLISEVDYLSGTILKTVKPANGVFENFFVTASGKTGFAVWNSSNGKAYALRLGSEDITPLESNAGNAATKARLIRQNALYPEFILESGPEAVLVKLEVNSGKADLVMIHKFKTLQEGDVVSFAISREKDSVYVSRVRVNPAETSATVVLIDVKSGTKLGLYQVPYNLSKSGKIVEARLDTMTKKESSAPGFRLLFVTECGNIEMHKEKSLVWVRHESLTETASALFVDLPEREHLSLEHDELNESVKESESMNPVSRYIRRWETHIEHLKHFVQSIPQTIERLTNPEASSDAPSASSNATALLHRDTLGFRKLLIFASKGGKFIGVETEKGRVVWTSYLPQIHVRQLELARSTVVKYPPVITVIGDDGKDTKIGQMNPLNGEILRNSWSSIQGIAKQVIQLPVEEPTEHLHPLAVVDRNTNIHIVPDTAEARKAFEQMLPTFYFYLSEGRGSTNVTGYSVIDHPLNGIYKTQVAWNLEFPTGEKLVTLAARDRDAQVASVGRVLGSRSVLYKYLSPNVLALATTRTTPKTSNLYLYVVDTITGAVFHRSSYTGAGNPEDNESYITLIQSEHMVVASFYNRGADAAEVIVKPQIDASDSFDDEPVPADGKSKGRKARKAKAQTANVPSADVQGYEIVVLEIFESVKPDTRIEGSEYSSFNVRRPHVQGQSFVFPFPITALGVTDTKLGISTREFLLGLGNDQLYCLNKRLLDVRRPMGPPSGEDKEEMLIPYHPVIGYNPREVPSYYLKVSGIKKIISSPADIESTSLVVAFGLDVFFARRAPSKTFDVLSEDFNYASLILTIVALVIGIQISKFFAQRKRLMDTWK